ncbi:YlxR family protein [Aeromicrobium sp. REDSEA-S38_B2]|uniref:YlxR family protein n=1 Tax=Aeromicrobium sp. REDSEA-S38_B2 TaxID=1811528 RepID=UPI0025797589|nr:YlxR family protein [Aeromicrobium sp. REDSEA-S38_B2]
MRTPRNDQLGDSSRAGQRGQHAPERRCVVTGDVAPAGRLVRLALGPDGTIAPDVLGKAPGRGAWIGVDRDALEAAQAKGKLKGGLARALHEGAFTIPERRDADPRQRTDRGRGAPRTGPPAPACERCRRGRAQETGASVARRRGRRRLGP